LTGIVFENGDSFGAGHKEKTLFERYLNKDQKEILKQYPWLLRLSGEIRNLSIFSDIECFR